MVGLGLGLLSLCTKFSGFHWISWKRSSLWKPTCRTRRRRDWWI